MKRSPELTPLSRDHHHALEAARRLRRADDATLVDALAHFGDFWQRAGLRHFEIEEQFLLPAIGRDDAEWAEAAARVEREHEELRAGAAGVLAGDSAADLRERARALGELLNQHVRFEERHLFPLLEQRLAPDQLASLGAAIERAEAG
jgi:hemerythrin-like domain-containing protein